MQAHRHNDALYAQLTALDGCAAPPWDEKLCAAAEALRSRVVRVSETVSDLMFDEAWFAPKYLRARGDLVVPPGQDLARALFPGGRPLTLSRPRGVTRVLGT